MVTPPGWAVTAHEPQSEQPARVVTVTRGFWIDKYEVTNAAFRVFVDAGGYDSQAWWSDAGWKWRTGQRSLPRTCAGDHPQAPRACVTWYEAEAYAHWRGGQLPTEAQWEYAARGPESRIYPWGDTFDPARCNIAQSQGALSVGSFLTGVSWVGAHDLAGNVMEWVQDWWSTSYYAEGTNTDPTGPQTGGSKVEKGGWWGGSAPSYIGRGAYRHFEDPPTYQDHHIGLRVVIPEPQP